MSSRVVCKRLLCERRSDIVGLVLVKELVLVNTDAGAQLLQGYVCLQWQPAICQKFT